VLNEDSGEIGPRIGGAEAGAADDQATIVESGIVAPTLTERLRERPLLSIGLAGLTGFVIGGGASSRIGAAALMFIARIWLKRAATDALANAISSYGTAKRDG
jgi:hypothetical protein